MALGTWWYGDPLPALAPLADFSACRCEDIEVISQITGLATHAIQTRWEQANHCYLAYIQHTPVAYGWVATAKGAVREIGLAFTLPEQDYYLWDFLTLSEWRGRGVYPHFLQAILKQEEAHAHRFWILYEPGNDSAAHSIRKAGFQFVGELILGDGIVSGIELFKDSNRARAGAQVLQLPPVRP